MTIKVKHILLVILIVVVAIILYNVLKQPIRELILKDKYEKEIIDYLNLQDNVNLEDGKIWDYEFYKNYYNEPDIDISPLIESYIKQIESNEEHSYNGEFSVKRTSNLRREILCDDYTYTAKLYHGINRIASISELEKIIIHKSNDKYNNWCIPKDSPSIIELPYNFYLKYEPSDFKLLDNVKKVTKCTFIDPLTEYSYNGRKNIILKYVDNNDKENCINSLAIIDDINRMVYSIGVSSLYYTQSHNAKIELCNHDYDEWLKEKEKEYEKEPWWGDQSELSSDRIGHESDFYK